MKRTTHKSPDPAALRDTALSLLSTNGNRLVLLQALLVLVVAVMPYYCFSTAFLLLMDGTLVLDAWVRAVIAVAFWVLITLLSLLLTLPLLLGFLRIGWDIETRGESAITRVFYYFGDGTCYRRAISLSFGALWRIALIVVAVALTCQLTLRFFAGSYVAGLACGVLVVIEIALWCLLALRSFPTLAVAMYDQTPLPRAREIARELARRCPTGGVKFFLRFLPSVLLGLLTFGIFLIWEVLPRMCVTYFLYCRRMNEMIIQSEENKNNE